jgi:phospholipase C
MTDTGPASRITNVFVLMLENHSFDNIFAMSGIPGITAATPDCCNSYPAPGQAGSTKYCVTDDARPFMATDPGHEFDDVLQQLCGAEIANCYAGGKYPPIDMSGFASSYATSKSELTWQPSIDHIGDIMACFDTKKQLPVIHRLATEFAICDHWYSSIPGPTWPNRFFVHGASSANWTDSPHLGDEVEWMIGPELGFRYKHGSIFKALRDAGHDWRLYQDKKNCYSDNPSGPQFGGWISQVASLHGVTLRDIHEFQHFADDLKRTDADGNLDYLKYPYTFIEPNFGKSFFAPQPGKDCASPGDRKWYDGPTYKGGSSQHPEDDPSGGEGLIKAVYEAIRNSPLWDTSLLVIVYDEHGGFYDCVPPDTATPPGDESPFLQKTRNARGFDFGRYGARVPAVVVSPLIPKGTVDTTIYDHASVPATLERLFGFGHLTDRDKAACDLRHLLSLPTPRQDCPTRLPDPAKVDAGQMPVADAQNTRLTDDALPLSGNVVGFLHILLKGEMELSGTDKATRQSILDRFKTITTKTQAMDYIATIYDLVEAQIAKKQ